ncbi:MAG: hypothetical protein QXO98_00090 [Sulfolobales archaeon]
MVDDSFCSDNVIYIGKKFFMRYVVAVLVKFNKFNCSEVVLKARGSNVSKAVLIAESSKQLIKNLNYRSIVLGSSYLELGGLRKRLSTIKIVISRVD